MSEGGGEKTSIGIRTRVRASVSPNIALVKYWGKLNEELIIPTNASISFSLPHSIAKTVTIVQDISTTVIGKEDKQGLGCEGNDSREEFGNRGTFTINGHTNLLEEPHVSGAILKICGIMHNLSGLDGSASDVLEIITENTFPTGAGLASSASGFAALVLGLWGYYSLKVRRNILFSPTKPCAEVDATWLQKELSCPITQMLLSGVSRLGSGSACRCFYSFALWSPIRPPWERILREGETRHGIELNPQIDETILCSCAKSLRGRASDTFLKLGVILCIVSSVPKAIASRQGMQNTVCTSSLFRERVRYVNDVVSPKMEDALETGDIKTMLVTMMKDSDSMHATCMDSWPPIKYLNEVSWQIIQVIIQFNLLKHDIVAGYTFDAGPNAVILCLQENTEELIAKLQCVQGIQKILAHKKDGAVSTSPFKLHVLS